MTRNQPKNWVLSWTTGLVMALILWGLSGLAAPAMAATKTLFVAHYRLDCPDGPGECLLVKENQYDDWTVIGGGIHGLDYEDGVAYEVRVQEEAPSRFRLLRVVDRVEIAASEPRLLRGYVVLGLSPEARSFRLCGSSEELWVQDNSGGELLEIYFKKTDAANQPLYVEFTGHLESAPAGGYGAHYPGQARVIELRRTALESPDCAQP